MPESAKVEILIDAFTEAAQEAVESVGDSLNNLSADAQPAQSAMDGVSDELNETTGAANVAGEAMDETSADTAQLAAAMQALKSRADEAGDEVAQAGAKASVTSGLFSSLTVSTDGLSVAMGTLSTVATLSLIPSLLTLSTVLLPLAGILGGIVAAAGSLVAVFAGLAATGVATHMKELKTAMAEAKKQIAEIIQPLGQVFGPLLVDAVQALPTLVRRIVDSLGPLGQFADALRQLGSIAMQVIPAMTGVMFDLATRALPVLIDVINYLRGTGPAVFNAVADAMTRLGPPLMSLGSALVDLLPTLYNIGITVGELVIPALTRIVGVIDQVASFVMSLDQNLRRLAVAGAITAPAILGVASSLGSLLGPLGVAAAAVTAFAAAYRSNFMGVRDVTNQALAEAMDVLKAYAAVVKENLSIAINQAQDFASAFQQAFQNAAGGAVAQLGQNLSGYIRQVIDLLTDLAVAMRPIMRTVGRTLTRNAGTFAQFGRMAVQALNGLITVLRTVVLPTIRFVFMQFTIPLLRRLANVWSRHFGTILKETIETVNALVSYVQPVLAFLATLWRTFGDEITTVVRFTFDVVIGILGTALDAIYTAIVVVLNLIQGDWTEAWNAIAGFFERTLKGLTNFVNNWKRPLAKAFIGVLNGIWNLTTDFWNGLADWLATPLGIMLTQIEVWGTQLYNAMASIWNAVVTVVGNATEALINNAINAINAFLETLDKVADAISQIPHVNAPDVQQLQNVQVDTAGVTAQKRSIDRAAARRQNIQQVDIALTVEGDSPLADFLEQQIDAKQKEQQRQQTRRTRRQSTR